MKLNTFEFLLVNNPVRAFVQNVYEARLFRQMSSIRDIDTALEIGCGNGTGTRIIKKMFSPGKIVAIDLDERMIKKAKQRNTDESIVYHVMDASTLAFDDDSFDAIFDFGIIHHIPDWKACIQELGRVLKPGGEILLEDMSIESFTGLSGRFWKLVLDHPYNSMYTFDQFRNFMIQSDFEITNLKKLNFLGAVRFFSLSAINTKQG